MKWDNSERGIWLAESATSKPGRPFFWEIEVTSGGTFRCTQIQGSLRVLEGTTVDLDDAKDLCERQEAELLKRSRPKRMTHYGEEGRVYLKAGDGDRELFRDGWLSDWTDEDLAKLGLMRKPGSGMGVFACVAALNKIAEMPHSNPTGDTLHGECPKCLAQKALAEIGKTE